MAKDPIVFAMANPDPEIRPELIQDIAAVIATGRSDFPNQINNVLAFPGIFRGALDAGATRDHREHEGGGRRGHRHGGVVRRPRRPTSSSRRCSTGASSSWSAPAVAEAARAEGMVRT